MNLSMIVDWINARPPFLVNYFGSVLGQFEMFTFSMLTAWIHPRPIQLAIAIFFLDAKRTYWYLLSLHYCKPCKNIPVLVSITEKRSEYLETCRTYICAITVVGTVLKQFMPALSVFWCNSSLSFAPWIFLFSRKLKILRLIGKRTSCRPTQSVKSW